MEEDKNFSISISWNVEDIQTVAEELEIAVTVKEAVTILKSLESNHDAEYGIKWDDIQSELNYLKINQNKA